MLRVLLVTDSYPPEIRSAAVLMAELAEELTARGHKITVLTTWPQFNLEAGVSPDDFREVSDEGNIDVIRVRTLPHHKVGYWLRGFAQLMMPFQLGRALRRHGRSGFDVAFVYSPPLPLGLLGAKLRRSGTPFLFNVQDVFPQNAIDLGILTNPAAILFFRKMERYIYGRANVVSLHSPGNHALVAGQHPALASKFTTLHNWIDAADYSDSTATRDFRSEFGLEGKTVALFAGVIGPAQNAGFLLDVAQACTHLEDLVFLFVGDGAEREALETRVKTSGLRNVAFQAFVSRKDYPDLLAAADIGLVSLHPKSGTPVVPGKLLGYMAGALPVAAFINEASDAHAIIHDSGCGRSSVSGDLSAAVATMEDLCRDRPGLAAMGASGRTYAFANFSRQACIDNIESLAHQLADKIQA